MRSILGAFYGHGLVDGYCLRLWRVYIGFKVGNDLCSLYNLLFLLTVWRWMQSAANQSPAEFPVKLGRYREKALATLSSLEFKIIFPSKFSRLEQRMLIVRNS
jgi:hypothetical protein